MNNAHFGSAGTEKACLTEWSDSDLIDFHNFVFRHENKFLKMGEYVAEFKELTRTNKEKGSISGFVKYLEDKKIYYQTTDDLDQTCCPRRGAEYYDCITKEDLIKAATSYINSFNIEKVIPFKYRGKQYYAEIHFFCGLMVSDKKRMGVSVDHPAHIYAAKILDNKKEFKN